MRERELFIQALDIADPAARSRFLDRVCRGDRALREGLDSLLSWHARGEGWLEEPLPERLAAEHALVADADTPPDVGARAGQGLGPDDPRELGGVRLLGPLPDTPFGPAWSGIDEAGDLPVIVKMLDAAWARDPQARGRFLATARSLSALRHASLPRVVAVGESPLPWIASERVDALPLAAIGPRPDPDATLRLGIDLAGALGAIHDVGLVHRALSPEVVFVSTGSSAPRVWLVDVGLAQALGGPTVPVPPGARPGFLAPEQVLGGPLDPLDHRPDLFALGCVLGYLFTGRSPFDSAAPEGVLRRVADAAPRPEVMAALPPAVAGVVTDLLRADPAARPGSAHDVVARLSRDDPGG